MSVFDDLVFDESLARDQQNAHAKLVAPGLAKLVALLDQLVRNDRELRRVQSLNVERASAFRFQQITSAAPQQLIRVQEQLDNVYSGCWLTFDATSGAGKYRFDGPPATTTSGLDIPAGFFQLWISGIDNLRNFSVIATSATDVRMSYVLFQ